MTNIYKLNKLKKFGNIGNNVRIDSSVKVINPQNIYIGSNVRVDAFCIFSAQHPIIIGNNVHISAYSQLSSSGGIITLNDFVGISSRVNFFTSSDDYSQGFLTNPTIPDEYKKIKSGPIILENHVIIGCGSILMPNIILKTGCSVGALSFINKNVPEFLIVGGNPLKLIGKRNKDNLLKLERLFNENNK